MSQTFAGIKAGEKFTGLYDWTTLEKEGQWVFRVQTTKPKALMNLLMAGLYQW
ncbi:MAG: hypothetical protein IPO02_13800 [Bacteroidetes bacterium]|nr:hypothetical protein [Bacteroidota bacterium]